MAYFDQAFVSDDTGDETFDFSGACKSNLLSGSPQASIDESFQIPQTKCCGEYPYR